MRCCDIGGARSLSTLSPAETRGNAETRAPLRTPSTLLEQSEDLVDFNGASAGPAYAIVGNTDRTGDVPPVLSQPASSLPGQWPGREGSRHRGRRADVVRVHLPSRSMSPGQRTRSRERSRTCGSRSSSAGGTSFSEILGLVIGVSPVAIKCPLHLSLPPISGWLFSTPMGGSTGWLRKLTSSCPVTVLTLTPDMILKTCALLLGTRVT